VVAGPYVQLAPHARTALALMLHELAPNAAKYGALSSPTGSVALTWEVAGNGEARRLALSWRERGGPLVSPPERKGFGMRLIERGLAAELRGEVRVDYDPQGLACTLTAPLPWADEPEH
jgi:two-component sensor histidine kinase